MCECVRVWNDRLQGLSGQASVLIHCSSSQPTQAPSLVGWPCPGRPGWRGSVFGTMQTLWCAGGGVGATQRSSSLQRQEEDGHEPPELRVGLAGGSTAGHHHHFIGIHLLPRTFSLLQCDIVYGDISQVA